MLVKDFFQGVKNSYAKYFPQSKCFVGLAKNLYCSIGITCCLASDSKELQSGIWENDMFHIRFSIDTLTGALKKDITEDSELPENLRLECSQKSYTIKPTERFMVYGSKSIPFRKTTGDSEKLLKALDNFFKKLHASLLEDYDNGVIHEHHTALLYKKIQLPRITVKCYYENGDTVTTDINATFKQAETYYVGKVFNLGSVNDDMQKCTKIELIK
jgi:hypothetical protein